MIYRKKAITISFIAAMFCVTAGHALQIGAWVGGSGATPQPTQANVDAFQALQGRKIDILSLFVIWGLNDWAFTQTYADIAEKNGSILLVTWMPNGYPAPRIVAGDADAYVKKYAQDLKKYGKTVWLRPLHEANGDWYDWGIGKSGAGNTNQNLIEAFRRIVGIFRDEGVTNVKWVWTTNATNSAGGSFTGHYPGDEWVDMTSIDGYNWGTAQSWSSWQSFEQVFSPAYAALDKIAKPMFIAEFSSSEHGGDKAGWIRDMFAVLPVKFPKLFALMWFSQSKSAEADWAVNTSESALAAWKEGVAGASAALVAEAGRTLLRVRRIPGGVELLLEKPEDAAIAFFGMDGREAARFDLGRLGRGAHVFPVPADGTALAYKVMIGGQSFSAALR